MRARRGPSRADLLAHLRTLREFGVDDLPVSRAPGSRVRCAIGEAPRKDDSRSAESSETVDLPPVRVPVQEGLFSPRPVLPDAVDPAERLLKLQREEIGECVRCRLAEGRKTIVFGSGNARAALMFVGEGPGADEDEQGLPFVGRAGQLLTRMIESMVVSGRRLRREDAYIANIVKCRPPGNRNPEPDEIAACEGFLFAQIAIVRPTVIVALGSHAAHTLLRTRTPISSLRGRFHEYRGALLMPTFHPAYVLRNYTEQTRRAVYEDLKKVVGQLEQGGGRSD